MLVNSRLWCSALIPKNIVYLNNIKEIFSWIKLTELVALPKFFRKFPYSGGSAPYRNSLYKVSSKRLTHFERKWQKERVWEKKYAVCYSVIRKSINFLKILFSNSSDFGKRWSCRQLAIEIQTLLKFSSGKAFQFIL